jgi:hypothetical protein
MTASEKEIEIKRLAAIIDSIIQFYQAKKS